MKDKMKVLFSSFVSIALSASIAVGGTLALFTDQSSVSVAVTSGKVDVEATINKASLATSSRGVPQQQGFFANDRGTEQGATFDENDALVLKYITPGDKAEFKIDVTNNSNVDIRYRAVAYAEGTLAEHLVCTVSVPSWTFVEGGAAIAPVEVSVLLPETVTYKDIGNIEPAEYNATVTFTVEAIQGNGIVDVWDGTAATEWFEEAPETQTEFKLDKAEQVAGLVDLVDAGETFEGKTIKLESDMDLYKKDENGEAILFDPIGSYRNDQSFKGTFDGQGYTIKNLSQNTWGLDNGYYYSDCGLGLFGAVEEGTVKNLTIDGANISGESALCGTIAAVAHNATFENITVKNANVADYQYYAGGIVGWASGEVTLKNCNMDASTTIAAQWGDFDNSIGGVIGGASASAEIHLKDCTIACRIDAYNDVTSSYQWYAYRRAGMLIGNSGVTESIDGRKVAVAPQLTCENVTVIYDDWANYTYCEFAGTSWPYVRVQAGVSNSAYSNPRYGQPTDANGNKVVDDNHVHNEGEDHHVLIVFDQLYGGGQGVYGTATHSGVTVIYNNDRQ